ncbi:MAG: S8 family peptidase [Rhodobacterales bacterium]
MGNLSLRKLSLRNLSGSAALCLLLAGCGGDSDGTLSSSGTAGVLALLSGAITSGQFSPNALSAGFVDSFAAFEGAARALRDSPEYQVQNFLWRAGNGASGPTYDSYSLASSRVEYAHAVGLYGREQKIAILDDGFLTTHESIAGRIIGGASGAQLMHGTAVASVAAGSSDYMVGIAPQAQLLLGTYESAASRAAATNLARTEGAVVQNNSWGFPGYRANANDFNRLFIQGDNSIYLSALRQYTQNGVVVFAADNNRSATSAGLLEALPSFAPELEPGWLAVISGVPRFDNDRIISVQRLSSACLEAARWCLTADGAWMAADADPNNTSYGLVSGTSFAAPVVSGAIALLAEAFPDLTPHDLRARLIATADNRFDGFTAAGALEVVPGSGFYHDYSTEWGHGFLDVRAALLPIGTPVAVMADGSAQSADQPLFIGGGATGDAVARSLAATPVLVTDALGGDFTMPGAALAATAAPAPITEKLWSAMLGPAPRSGLLRAYGGPDRTIRQDGMELSLLAPGTNGPAGHGKSQPALAAAIGQTLDAAGGELFIGVNITRDDGTILPGIGDGTSVLTALELAYRRDVGRAGFIAFGGTFGMAPDRSGAAMSEQSSVRFNALRVETGQSDIMRDGDSLSFGMSLPVAVTSGGAQVALPVSRSDGIIQHQMVGIDYAPQDREINLSLTYSTPFGRQSDMFVGAIHAVNHGNIAGRQDTAALVGLRISF